MITWPAHRYQRSRKEYLRSIADRVVSAYLDGERHNYRSEFGLDHGELSLILDRAGIARRSECKSKSTPRLRHARSCKSYYVPKAQRLELHAAEMRQQNAAYLRRVEAARKSWEKRRQS